MKLSGIKLGTLGLLWSRTDPPSGGLSSSATIFVKLRRLVLAAPNEAITPFVAVLSLALALKARICAQVAAPRLGTA